MFKIIKVVSLFFSVFALFRISRTLTVHNKEIFCADLVKVTIFHCNFPCKIIVQNDRTNKADYFIIGDSFSPDRDNIFAAFK